ncbi:MAG: class I SAM-dependent methyltransferase [Geobacteraceae bacterium]
MIVDNNFVHEQCPLCGFASVGKLGDITYPLPLAFSSKEIILKNKPELWKCRRCKSGFTQYAIPERAAVQLYEAGAGNERWISKPFVEEKPDEVIRVLEKIFLPGSRVLDVGCNTGELLDFARSRRCHTAGVEYSMASREFVKAKGHNIFTSFYETGGLYDVISAFDLVEHLYDIPLFFTACQNKLKDKGLVVILTGNFSCFSARITGADWWYVRFPEHIIFPSKGYFYSIAQFSVANWVRTYAATKFYSPIKDKVFSFVKGIQHGNYTALPSFGPDHVLVVLRKCKNV